ncbi:MAG: glycosyltransferase [Patescibacteria group bacterium]
MKILVISNLYPPISYGGAEQVAWDSVQEFCKKGHKVSVFSTRPFNKLTAFRLSKRERNNATVYRIWPFNIYHILYASRFPFVARMLWHMIDLWSSHSYHVLKSILAKDTPDVIITHNLKGFGLKIVKAIRQSKIPHVHILHDVQLSIPSGVLLAGEEHHWRNDSWLQRWYENQVKKIIGSPDIVISPSKYLSNFYKERGFFPKSNFKILTNPTPDYVIRIQKNRPSKYMRLFFGGKLEKHKGILVLLDALEKVKSPVHLHVVGNGTLADYISKRVYHDNRITYHGAVVQTHLMELMAICDVAIVPSTCYENSPRIIYECFHLGIPAIGTKIGGTNELIKEGENGMLVEPNNPEVLAHAIDEVFSKIGFYFDNANKIRASVEACSAKQYVEKLEEFISEIKR